MRRKGELSLVSTPGNIETVEQFLFTSNKMEMNQELAQRLLMEGATLVCIDVPHGTEFGIDMKSWNTADKFNGLKMIPPGWHYVHYSPTNRHGDMAPRIGFVHNFKRCEIVLKKWDDSNGELVDADDDMSQNFRANLKDMDRFLGPYPYDVWDKWKNLTNKISDEVVSNALPLTGVIRSALELTGSSNSERKEAEESKSDCAPLESPPKRKRKSRLFTDEGKDEELLPNLKPVEGTELRFSTFPEKSYPEGASPSEITRHSLDSSYIFGQILSQHKNVSDIIGEVQFSFICFLIGHSLEAFEHWKKLIGVLCSCDEALPKYINIFSDFLTVLNYQLEEIPEDFLVDIVASSNFVYNCLRNFFRNLHSSDVGGRLKSKAKRFQEKLTEKFLWDFSDILDEDEEDLPVVVETENISY